MTQKEARIEAAWGGTTRSNTVLRWAFVVAATATAAAMTQKGAERAMRASVFELGSRVLQSSKMVLCCAFVGVCVVCLSCKSSSEFIPVVLRLSE